ncbi:MAG TPA: hypothetical protein VM534_08175 [Thermoanaerobaculia bacterium]|nr:hypothetical protein [Thermoanaerobaculia bacterium]
MANQENKDKGGILSTAKQTGERVVHVAVAISRSGVRTGAADRIACILERMQRTGVPYLVVGDFIANELEEIFDSDARFARRWTLDRWQQRSVWHPVRRPAGVPVQRAALTLPE